VLVSSPISGRIILASASLGSFVQSETELFRIADPQRIQIEAAVTSIDAARISAGDTATIQTPTGGTITATVRAITPAVNIETRAATAVLVPTGGAGLLQPGQLVTVRIRPRTAVFTGGGVVVPDEALQTIDGRDSVFVRTPTGFRVQPVTPGARAGGHVAIVSGLTPDQVIATKNAFLLKAEIGKGAEEE
jgi:cobalt-zinc-cadmium efflux system membrane fusion protein